MTAPYTPRDELFLWWLADPAQPRWVGRLRLVRRTAGHPGGVSLEYADSWLADGLALSEDLPLRPGEFLPVENDAAAGAAPCDIKSRFGSASARLRRGVSGGAAGATRPAPAAAPGRAASA